MHVAGVDRMTSPPVSAHCSHPLTEQHKENRASSFSKQSDIFTR